MTRQTLLTALTQHELPFSAIESEALLQPAISLLGDLCQSAPCVEHALLEIVLRAIETRILADEVFVTLARLWPAYLGREESIIQERLKQLFKEEPPDQLVAYIRNCLRSRAGGTNTKANLTVDIVNDIFMRIYDDPDYNQQIRCEVCGFHFRGLDLGQTRRELAMDIGLKFASSLIPGRSIDPYKPIATTGKAASLLGLEIDHITPEAGFGWTSSDNLRVCCAYCNRGRAHFRRPQEPLATAVASSLMLLFDNSQHSLTKQQTVVSTIAIQGRCVACGTTRYRNELTVRQKPTAIGEREWFVPWCVDVYCYACAS